MKTHFGTLGVSAKDEISLLSCVRCCFVLQFVFKRFPCVGVIIKSYGINLLLVLQLRCRILLNAFEAVPTASNVMNCNVSVVLWFTMCLKIPMFWKNHKERLHECSIMKTDFRIVFEGFRETLSRHDFQNLMLRYVTMEFK